MKRILLILIFLLLLFSNSVSRPVRVICFHYNHTLTINSCNKFKDLVFFLFDEVQYEDNLISNIDKYKLSLKLGYYDIVYLAGYGGYSGFWKSEDGKTIIKWCDLVNMIKTRYLLVDSCYAGNIFKCDYSNNINFVLTSTNSESMSVNVYDLNGEQLSSFVLALYLIGTQDEQYKNLNLIGCYLPDVDFQVCQFSIIFKMNKFTDYTFYNLIRFKSYHPNVSIGTILMNGLPLR